MSDLLWWSIVGGLLLCAAEALILWMRGGPR